MERVLGGAVPTRPPRRIDEPTTVVEQFKVSEEIAQAGVAHDAYDRGLHFWLVLMGRRYHVEVDE